MLEYISLGMEAVIVLLGVRMAQSGRRFLGGSLALSFSLYILYNLIKRFHWGVSEPLQEGIFFVATLTIFLAVLHLSGRRA
jgi:hypothetical protein